MNTKIRKVIFLFFAISLLNCGKVEEFLEKDAGLVSVYLRGPEVTGSQIAVAPQCEKLRGAERHLCIAQHYCAGKENHAYVECHSKTLVRLNHENRDEKKSIRSQIEKGVGAKGRHKERKRDEDEDEDDDDDDVALEPVKLIAEIESVEIYSEKHGWVEIGEETDDINIIDAKLNANIGNKPVPSGTYTRIKLVYGDENRLLIHSSLMNQTPLVASGMQGDYMVFALNYLNENDRIVTIEREFIVDDATTLDDIGPLELSITPDTNNCISFENGAFYFKPAGTVEQIQGGGYTQPNEPLNVTLDAGTLAVSAPAGIADVPVKITAVPLSKATLPQELPATEPMLIKAYEMSPSRVFDQPITLSMPYDKAALTAAGLTEENIRVGYFNESQGQWVNIPSFTVDPATQTIHVHTKHFTIIAATAGPGFKLVVPGGVSAKVDFDFLNYMVSKVVPNKDPFIELENDVKSYRSSNLNADFYPQNINTRDLKFELIGSGSHTGIYFFNNNWTQLTFTGIRVRVSTRKPIPFGRLETSYSIVTSTDCGCADFCSGWKIFPKKCYEACIWGCDQVQTVKGSQVREYTIDNLSFEAHYIVIRDDLTGSMDFQWIGMSDSNSNLSISNKVTSSSGNAFAQWMLNTLNDTMLAWKKLLFTTAQIKGGVDMGKALTGMFAESMPNAMAFTIDPQGVAYTQDLNTYNYFDNVANFSGNCAAALNITAPAAGSATPFQFTKPNHVGVGVSLGAFTELFTEFANRGYFCYNGPANLNGDTFQMTPNGPVALEYRGNYTYAVTFPMSVAYNTVTDSGTVSFLYRVKPGVGLSGLNLEFYGLEHTFTNTLFEAPLTYYFDGLKNLKNANPEFFNVFIPNTNPAGYAGLQSSMFHIDEPYEANGRLNFETKIEGFKYNYGANNKSAEWVWMNSFAKANDRCYPHLEGILRRPTASVYLVELANRGSVILINESVNSVLLNSHEDNFITLEGRCSGGKFYAKNIVKDMFYISDAGYSLAKSNYAAQYISTPNAFQYAIGVYAVDVNADGKPEILQIQDEPIFQFFSTGSSWWGFSSRYIGNELVFYWRLNNTITDPAYDANYYRTTAPPEIAAEKSIYRVVVNPNGPSNPPQILINCTVYNIAATSTTVSLSTAYDYCAPPASGWAWQSGSNTSAASGVYGTKGVENAANSPGAKLQHVSWMQNNELWIFGGDTYDKNGTLSYSNDLWRYNIASGKWTWMSGGDTVQQAGVYGTKGSPSAANTPGARRSAVSAVSGAKFWLFGGAGYGATASYTYLNDLWSFNPATNQWTWVSGPTGYSAPNYGTKGVAASTNSPPARYLASMCADKSGNLWLFGGNAQGGLRNDLWKYNIASGLWTWVAGSDQGNQPGIYDAQGAYTAQNTPGSRLDGKMVCQADGTLFLYGGSKSPNVFGDTWVFNPAVNQWKWISGSAAGNETPVYGTQGTPSAVNTPGARSAHTLEIAPDGTIWLYGGVSYSGGFTAYADLWKYDNILRQWVWVSGVNQANTFAVYGSLGMIDQANQLGSRISSTANFDLTGNLWFFGGYAQGGAKYSDLWSYTPQQ